MITIRSKKSGKWSPKTNKRLTIMAKYNGHKNYNHWNVSLWINNDEGLYNLAKDCIQSSQTKDDAAEKMLDYLERDNMVKTPDGVPYSKSTVRAAMVGM